MAIALHFCKSDNTPWGFRLTGGAECDVPLTVVKVTEGSFAENAGLEVDDVIVRINEDSTAGLTHAEAHEAFLEAGPDFIVAIRRGDVVDIQDDEQSNEEISNIMESSSPETFAADLELQHEKNIMSDKGPPRNSSKINATDEQIAEAISGETELLPDQNVLGVNFNKVDLTESTVLKVINEQTETKVDLQNKKWSTFLQTPKTPKVIPKKKEPEGPTAPPYRVIIKKQEKKTAEATSQKVEASSTLVVEETNETDIQELEEPEYECEQNIEESEKDEAELEQEDEQELLEETLDETKLMNGEVSGEEEEEQMVLNSIGAEEKISETESSVTLEEQLAQVQQQLQALSQLPSAIQVSLDAVTQQLAKIVRATHKGEEETTVEQSVTSEDERTEQYIEGDDVENLATLQEAAEASEEESITDDEAEYEHRMYQQMRQDLDTSESSEQEQEHEQLLTDEEQEAEPTEAEKVIQQERASTKLLQMEESHQRRLEQRPTHPLTPLQRPIILPGGRRWSQPNDALPAPRKPKMTDEKISKTIEIYSEVITGRTKGLTNGMLFGRGPTEQSRFTERRTQPTNFQMMINFLKYQPPPKNLDYLQRSEVFRLVHDMDPPQKGIAARPGKVILSEQDYYTENPYQTGQHAPVEV